MFKELRDGTRAFLIAEVGQNHQGDLELAKEYIRVFASAGADAIKFQTRNNRALFSREAYDAPYASENAFGSTYGEHREALELRPDWLPELREECHLHGVAFMSTAFDEPSLELLVDVAVDALKIASFDAGNTPFITRVAGAGLPVVLSTGGAQWNHILNSVAALSGQCLDSAVLHCVSQYPCDISQLGLEKITRMLDSFPSVTVGLSDHFNGTLSGPVAYMLGARVFEKHVTLNRSWKGTDHAFSLEPEGFRKFARDISRVALMLPSLPDSALGEETVFQKLGKSVVAASNLQKGHTLQLKDLSGKIFSEKGVPVRDAPELIGKTLVIDVNQGEKISFEALAD